MNGTIVGVVVTLDAAVALVSSHGHSVLVEEAVVVRVAGMELVGAAVVEAGVDELGAMEADDELDAMEADDDAAVEEDPAPAHRAAAAARTACEISQDFSE